MNEDLLSWISREDPHAAEDLQRLRRLLDLLERYHLERWKRHVSAGDALVDRWTRARRLGFGEGASVYDSALIIGDVRVGRGTWVGPQTVLDGSGGLAIGDFCSISAGAQLYSHDTVRWALSGGATSADRDATNVGSRTYIGPNVIVAKGVTIGEGCVIGAASLVLRDIPAGSVAYGTPARVTGKVDEYLASTQRPPTEAPL